MHRLLRGENNMLFLLARAEWEKASWPGSICANFRGEYATLVWLTYNTDIQEMLISDQFLLIRGLESEKQDLTTPQAREAYYEKKAELSQRALQFRLSCWWWITWTCRTPGFPSC